MIKILTALYDSKRSEYINFVFTDNINDLLRNYKIMVNEDSKSLINKCAEDFTLYQLAVIDTEKGLVSQDQSTLKVITQLIALKDVKE